MAEHQLRNKMSTGIMGVMNDLFLVRLIGGYYF